MMLGLGSRRWGTELPLFVSEHAGDALWACMIYCGMRLIFVNRSIALAVWFSLVFCYAIEFSQLYQAEWINSLRNTALGALVLGKGFLAVDLVRYTAGIVTAAAVDKIARRKQR
ncbi:DUF2809 domain-containing protein [Paenibacillaceae bacterium]|nr:DUF2809 domain-containing protein [Paenibacillaceae bacterium]